MTKQEILSLKEQYEVVAKRSFERELLRRSGLTVGDTVSCMFEYSYGDYNRSYTAKNQGRGIITQNEDFEIFIESVEEYPVLLRKSNGRIGKSYKEWNTYPTKKVKSSLDNIIIE